MLDVRDLEDRWKKYNQKRKRPFIVSGLLFLILILSVMFLKTDNINSYISKLFSHKISLDKNKVKENIETNSSKVKSIYLLNQGIVELESKNILKENITVKKSIDSLSPLDEDEIFTEKDISKPVIKKKHVKIIKVSNNSAYKDVERRFRRSHNINDSIFLANMYYKKRDYKKAIYWAMQTNKLDKNIEESWLIFAKAKVRLGYKNEAIRVLKAYIKRSNSYEAKKLLKNLIN